jgi:hypothetical protein
MQYLRKEDRLKNEICEEFRMSQEELEQLVEELDEKYLGRVSEYDRLKIIRRDKRNTKN